MAALAFAFIYMIGILQRKKEGDIIPTSEYVTAVVITVLIQIGSFIDHRYLWGEI